ncbi:MAG: nicotinamide mononucleotide transporter [Bacteroidales bacterium]|nr:nicotinamide mononucleotide transporter [Bacteroidales bacterium]
MEYFGFVTGLLYLIWEIRQNNLMWVVGILSALAYAFVFAQSALWAAMLFQVYYFCVSIYGLISWRRDKKLLASGSGNTAASSASSASTATAASAAASPASPASPAITYRIITPKALLVSAAACAAVFAAIYWVLARFTGDPMPVMDAVVATLGIVATYWLGKAYLHQWLLWVGVNVLSVWMFFSQGLYLTAFLYILYTLCAFYGFLHWKKNGVEISV